MKTAKKYLTSGEFAQLCKTSKATLRHYKDIRLLMPAWEDTNGYQYYETEQFYDYYLIHILKRTGTPLASIKSYMDRQNPESVLELLKTQLQYLTDEKKEIESMQQTISHAIANIELGLSGQLTAGSPQIIYMEEEHLIALPITELEETEEDIAFISLLHKYVSVCQHYGLNTDYQTGAILDESDFMLEQQTISHIYTKTGQPSESPYYRLKPQGYYLTFLDKGHWDTSSAYTVLAAYIREHRLQITGNIYAYDLAGYLLNGIEAHTMSLIMVPTERTFL